MNFYCFMYSFSVALISALALLKYANLRLMQCSKIDGELPMWCSYLWNIIHITSLHFVV